MEEKLYLCFIKLVGEENDGRYRYEFIFTDNMDEAWGDDFDYVPACLCNNLYPSDEYITKVDIVILPFKLTLAQDNCCFGMQDCYDGILCLGYSETEDGRLVLLFNAGDEENYVMEQIEKLK